MAEELNPFKISQMQLDKAAKQMNLDAKAHKILREPLRIFEFDIPVKLDNGKSKTFNGFRVQYNDALGPCKGGIRYHPEETIDTVKALAAWMTWKCAALGLPYGGGKGGVICNTKEMSQSEIERLSRGYVKAIYKEIGVDKDVPAPDVYTSGREMAWMLDEFEKLTGKHEPGMVTGKPLVLGGSLGRDEATGRGAVYTIREAAKFLKIDLKKASAAVQGCGNVGGWAAKRLRELFGTKVIAMSDSKCAIYDEKGIDVDKLLAYKEKNGSLHGFPGKCITNEELLELPCDILIPAALENQITSKNADKIKAKIVAEGANGPTTPEADEILSKKKIFVIPDFICNAGGVMVSYLEWCQNRTGYYWEVEEVYEKLDKVITRAFQNVLKIHQDKKVPMRVAAYMLAVQRVAEAMKLRGWC